MKKSEEIQTLADKTKSRVKIANCTCTCAYQDETFGKGMRAHNPNRKGYSCTVCGHLREGS